MLAKMKFPVKCLNAKIIWPAICAVLFLCIIFKLNEGQSNIDWSLVLEYLKVILTWPVAFLIVALTVIRVFREPIAFWLERLRIDYGGATLSSSQQISTGTEQNIQELEIQDQPLDQAGPAKQVTPVNKTDESELVQQWRANAYLWEYRYLNRYLVFHTQQFLDWLYDLNKPIALGVANSFWMLKIPLPEERQAVLNALRQHHLVELTGDQISVTEKGREYVTTRGKVAPAFPITQN